MTTRSKWRPRFMDTLLWMVWVHIVSSASIPNQCDVALSDEFNRCRHNNAYLMTGIAQKEERLFEGNQFNTNRVAEFTQNPMEEQQNLHHLNWFTSSYYGSIFIFWLISILVHFNFGSFKSMAIKSMTRHLFLLLLSFSLNCNALRTASRSGCVKSVDYAAAVARCASLSGELCTQNEIVVQTLGRNSGCGFDCYHTWTATSCAADSHWIAATGSSNAGCPQATMPSNCSLDTATQSPSNQYNTAIAVVCCFDTGDPTAEPTTSPTLNPSISPTRNPSASPTKTPSTSPSETPSISPTRNPSAAPTKTPSTSPTGNPSAAPTKTPSTSPTNVPSQAPIMTTESASEDDSYEDSIDSGDVDAAAMQHAHTMDSDTSVERKHVHFNIKVDRKTAINVAVMIIVLVFSNMFLYFCICKTKN